MYCCMSGMKIMKLVTRKEEGREQEQNGTAKKCMQGHHPLFEKFYSRLSLSTGGTSSKGVCVWGGGGG